MQAISMAVAGHHERLRPVQQYRSRHQSWRIVQSLFRLAPALRLGVHEHPKVLLRAWRVQALRPWLHRRPDRVHPSPNHAHPRRRQRPNHRRPRSQIQFPIRPHILIGNVMNTIIDKSLTALFRLACRITTKRPPLGSNSNDDDKPRVIRFSPNDIL